MHGRYYIRHLLQGLVVAIGILALSFVFFFVLGNPVLLLLPPEASPEEHAHYRQVLGLDQPLWVQFATYMGRSLTGQMGNSLYSGEPALQLVLARFFHTAQLVVPAVGLALAVGIPLGIIAALHQGRVWDRIATILAVSGQSVPLYWLGLMLMVLFAVRLHWLPVSGKDGLSSFIMPVVTFSTFSIPLIARLVRNQLVDVMERQYIALAIAKGVSFLRVLLKHALKNALIPVVAALGAEVGAWIGVSIMVETVFAWPGLGDLLVNSLLRYDYPVVSAALILFAWLAVSVSVAADLVVTYLDPRIRL